MDLTQNKPIIISCGIGGHYAAGVERLERSLIYSGWAGDMLMLKNEYPEGCPNINDNNYAFKPYLFQQIFNRGYTCALWLDASFWAIKNPMEILDYINDNGLYFFKSGYPLSATATDKLLYKYDCSRESLVDISEFATGAVGINISNPKGKEFFNKWMEDCNEGLFIGNRNHDENDSKHPLFSFSRQDQSDSSMILHKMGITTAGEDKDWIAYKDTPHNAEKVIFFIGGIG